MVRIIKKIITTQKAKREPRLNKTEANGNKKIISRSKIKYKIPIT
jgi:hypothetical protein